MTLSQSVASELLAAFRAGEGVDLVRESVRLVMQELVEVDAAEQIGASRYQRTEDRITHRNGSLGIGSDRPYGMPVAHPALILRPTALLESPDRDGIRIHAVAAARQAVADAF